MSNDDFSIVESEVNPKTCKLTLNGRITSVTSIVLNHKLDEAYKNYSHIILNMQRVMFLSSGGIRILLTYFKILSGSGGSLLIENPSENVRNVLGMVALNEMLLK